MAFGCGAGGARLLRRRRTGGTRTVSYSLPTCALVALALADHHDGHTRPANSPNSSDKLGTFALGSRGLWRRQRRYAAASGAMRRTADTAAPTSTRKPTSAPAKALSANHAL